MKTLNPHFDWISITLPYSSIVSIPIDSNKFEINNFVRDEFPELCDWLTSFPDAKIGKGNRIFNRSVFSQVGGFSIFWNANLPFTLIEITGTGCQNLREAKLVAKMVYHHADFLTRLDIAVDFETDIRPIEFCQHRLEGRFSAHADIVSDTGETYYVGSRNSSRFCRVYRYNAPHPRSALLRVEFQLKKDEAKLIGACIRNTRIKEICSNLFATFQFTHPIIGDLGNGAKTKAAPRNSKMGKTERWLFSQVLPACKKLADDGSIEILDIFLKELYAYYDSKLIQKEYYDGKTFILPNLELPSE